MQLRSLLHDIEFFQLHLHPLAESLYANRLAQLLAQSSKENVRTKLLESQFNQGPILTATTPSAAGGGGGPNTPPFSGNSALSSARRRTTANGTNHNNLHSPAESVDMQSFRN